MDTSKLKPETRRAWEQLESDPLLAGFVLAGGTALAMRIGHRVSEDLDFAYLGQSLPRQRLAQLVQAKTRQGLPFVLNQDPNAEQEFINSGLELEDHQQDYLVNNATKVSFVRFSDDVTSLFSGDMHAPLRVATLDEIFKTKSLVCADRSKSRDWLDLHVLLTRHGYTLQDMRQVFADIGNLNGFAIASQRLRSCVPSRTDEGYEQLLENPPSLENMREYFSARLDELEISVSRAAFKARLP